MQQIRFCSCEHLAIAESESDDCPARIKATLPAWGKWLDKVVARGDSTTLYQAQHQANFRVEERLVAHAFVVLADRNFMWAERRAAAAYGRAYELGHHSFNTQIRA